MPSITPNAAEMEIARRWAALALAAQGPYGEPQVTSLRQGWGLLRHGRSLLDRPLCLGGRTFSGGLGAHAESEIAITLPSPGRRLRAFVGVDDNDDTRRGEGSPARIVFTVQVGGQTVWSSPPRGIADGALAVDLPLGGTRQIKLLGHEVHENLMLAHVDWADLRIELEDGREFLLYPADGEPVASAEPLSFLYGGRSSAELLPGWDVRQPVPTSAEGTTTHRIIRRDPATGLECELELTLYADFPAVEWVGYFHNTGSADSPILADIQALDCLWHCGGAATLHRSLGSQSRVTDFMYQSDPLPPGQTIDMTAGGGRSSNNWLPFFNLQMGDGGAIVALGWTGQWAARFQRRPDGVLHARAGMELTHLKLHPGERIRTPRMLLLFWQGDSLRGHNLLRQFILRHHRPTVDGRPAEAPLSCPTWGGMRSKPHMERIDACRSQKLAYDYYWIDAGWYGPPDSYSPDEHKGDWWKHVGNWSINPAAHPQGLRPIADAVHAAGMRFLLWFEPERAISGTPLPVEHPDWFLGERRPNGNLLLDLGNGQARQWMTDFICGFIEANGVDCYRQDFNFDPLPYWRANDSLDRQGMTEIRHIEGLYAYWDELRRRYPHLLIDNCASGGRRIDLETVSRAIPLWRSDVQCSPNFDPTAGQVHTHGLSYWVPLSATGTHMKPLDTYNFRSALSAGVDFSLFGYEYNPVDPKYPYDWHRKMIADYLRARPFYTGDYYPLTHGTPYAEDWDIYQMHRGDLEKGFVAAFRREGSPFSAGRFRLHGLDESLVYEVEDADDGAIGRMTGKELAQQGLPITMGDPRQAKLFFYRKA